MNTLTFLGYPVPALITIALFSLILLLLNLKQACIFLIVSSAGAATISEALKVLIARPRPDMSLVSQIEVFIKSDSFPSGHVLLYIGIYGYLLYLVLTRLKKGLLRTVLVFLFLIILFLIGVSRIYLGAHWFSDVIGSYLIGSIWILCVIYWESKLSKPLN